MDYKEKLKILKDKNTSTEILEQLSSDESFEIKLLIIRHTNTSNKTLEKILSYNDIELNFNIYNRKDLGNALMESLKPFHELFDKLNTLSQIIEHYSSFYSQLIIEIKSFKLNNKAIEELSNNKNLGIKTALAQNQQIPLKILEQLLIENNTVNMQDAIAGNPNTSYEMLEGLIKLNRISLKYIIYCRNDSESKIKEQLVNYKELFAAIISERNYNMFSYKLKSIIDTIVLEKELIEELSADDFYDTRAVIAGSMQTPAAILKKLASDDEYAVVTEVAKNPNTDFEILKDLVKSKDYHILEGIAKNPNTPVGLLLELSKSKPKQVKEALSKHLLTNKSSEKLEKLIKYKKFRRPISKNPFISPQIIEMLSTDQDYSVRNAIAKNTNTPMEILQKLLTDQDDMVRLSAKLSLDKKGENTKKPRCI